MSRRLSRLVEPTEKACADCGRLLPITSFTVARRYRRKTDGALVELPFPECKSCRSAALMERYHNETGFREKHRSWVDRSRDRRKMSKITGATS